MHESVGGAGDQLVVGKLTLQLQPILEIVRFGDIVVVALRVFQLQLRVVLEVGLVDQRQGVIEGIGDIQLSLEVRPLVMIARRHQLVAAVEIDRAGHVDDREEVAGISAGCGVGAHARTRVVQSVFDELLGRPIDAGVLRIVGGVELGIEIDGQV